VNLKKATTLAILTKERHHFDRILLDRITLFPAINIIDFLTKNFNNGANEIENDHRNCS